MNQTLIVDIRRMASKISEEWDGIENGTLVKHLNNQYNKNRMISKFTETIGTENIESIKFRMKDREAIMVLEKEITSQQAMEFTDKLYKAELPTMITLSFNN